MQNIRILFLWENNYRIRTLSNFIKNYVAYFDAENDVQRAEQYRPAINYDYIKVRRFLLEVKSYQITGDKEPLVVVGARNLDPWENLFKSHELHVGPRQVLDDLERAIGVYSDNHIRSILNTFNPFQYLYRAIQWASSLPFKFLSEIGLHGKTFEASLFGRVIKGFIQAVLFVASLFSIFEFLGISSSIKSFLYELLPF